MGLNVVLLGYGAIGRSLHGMLARHAPSIEVLGVLDRTAGSTGTGQGNGQETGSAADPATRRWVGDADSRLPVLTLAEALERADVIAECASPAAVRALGPAIIVSGTDLLVASLGALVDAGLRTALLDAGPGKTYLSTGAIGGLDLIRASAGTIQSIELDTRKPPAALLHAGLTEALRTGINEAATLGEPRTVFAGTVARAVALFPSNINVAAALGLAAGDLGLVHVTITADPAATQTHHAIGIRGSAGSYELSIANAPDPHNPATSALTARAMASGLLRLAGVGPHFI